ncbi:hypothetical protein FRC11_011116, partial [Ceratobasidium sp. 423]
MAGYKAPPNIVYKNQYIISSLQDIEHDIDSNIRTGAPINRLRVISRLADLSIMSADSAEGVLSGPFDPLEVLQGPLSGFPLTIMGNDPMQPPMQLSCPRSASDTTMGEAPPLKRAAFSQPFDPSIVAQDDSYYHPKWPIMAESPKMLPLALEPGNLGLLAPEISELPATPGFNSQPSIGKGSSSMGAAPKRCGPGRPLGSKDTKPR